MKRNRTKKHRMKGSFADIIFVMVAIFVTAIVILFANKLLVEIKTAANETLNQTYFTQGENALKVMNGGFLLFVVAGFMAIVLSAFMIRSHPAFAVVGIIISFVFILLAVIFGNIYGQFVAQSELSSVAVNYPIITNIFQHFPLIVMVFAGIIMIVIFSKIRSGDSST